MTTEIKPTNGVATDTERGSSSMTREELRAHLDRRICKACGCGFEECQASPTCVYRSPSDRRWRDWFGPNGEYLGVASGRTGPDPVSGVQPCTCPTCQAHRTAPGRVEMVGGGE